MILLILEILIVLALLEFICSNKNLLLKIAFTILLIIYIPLNILIVSLLIVILNRYIRKHSISVSK